MCFIIVILKRMVKKIAFLSVPRNAFSHAFETEQNLFVFIKL